MFLQVPQNSRYEIKFISYEHNYHKIINWLKLHKLNFKKKYETRFINNIYFDSLDYKSFKSNIFGDSSRVKLRYRWYGNLSEIKMGTFEIKYKRNLYGWKRKFKINFDKFSDKINLKKFSKNISLNLPKREKIFFESQSIPKIVNRYQRDYFTNYNDAIRVTLDRNHEIFDQRFVKEFNFSKTTLSQRVLVMEFKFNRQIKESIDSIMKQIPIRASRNSKYVNSIRAVTGI